MGGNWPWWVRSFVRQVLGELIFEKKKRSGGTLSPSTVDMST